MPSPLRPGVFTDIYTKAAAEGVKRARTVAEGLAQVTETQAKLNASSGAHAYGTPTPASPGSGPARISGTLVRSITHTPAVLIGAAWTALVGPAPGFYPPYGIPKHHIKPDPKPRADSARYGYYLETGDHGITYPWLGPALDWVARGPVNVIPRAVFGAPWPMYA